MWFPLFILASSVCWSLQCRISALTQWGNGGHIFRLTCSIVMWGGRNTANKYYWCVWGVLAVFQPNWICPTHSVYTFMVYTSQALGCSAGELSELGPGLRAVPRSKLLRFRFLGTLQRCRLGWACVLCPSQVRAAQVTRCLVSTVTPRWESPSYCPPPQFQLLGFLGVQQACLLRCAVCLFWRANLWL